MSGKPFQSKLVPYQDDVFAWLSAGKSFRQIANDLNRVHRLNVTHNAVFSFAKSRRGQQRGFRLFYDGLSTDLRDQLTKQVAAIWTHGSTALEGNTLTLGDTFKVLELGFTISGKPLREHQEVYGHARAIELLYRMLSRASIAEQDLFDLHRAVMPPAPVDALNPIGDWKQSYNGTSGMIDGRLTFMEYAEPLEVPNLMRRWMGDFNRSLKKPLDSEGAVQAYAEAHLGFVRVHPFFDGNGRIARLVANLPVLLSGFPPVVIPKERRGDYIGILWEYEHAVGKIRHNTPLVPPYPAIEQFKHFLRAEWRQTLDLVETFRKRESERRARGVPPLAEKP